jgi:hypothetical protein
MKNQPGTLGGDGGVQPTPPVIPFWHMKPNADGRSTIEQQRLADFIMQSVSGDAEPFWMREFCGDVKAVWFNVMPVGWVGEWHPSPALQWVVVLSGKWFIETQDGARVEMGPGDIHWGEDVSDAAATSPIQHRSGQIGDHPCVQMMVQFNSTREQF